MVLLTRSLCRIVSQSIARPAAASRASLFTAAAARTTPQSRVLSRGALPLAPRHSNNHIGSIRTLTGKREKVKVLLVLYDGKKHAEEVSINS
jgi:formate dehydrogenase